MLSARVAAIKFCAGLLAVASLMSVHFNASADEASDLLLRGTLENGNMIQLNGDLSLDAVQAVYGDDSMRLGTRVSLKDNTILTVVKDERLSKGTITFVLDTDDTTPEIPTMIEVSAAQLFADPQAVSYVDLDQTIDDGDPDAILSYLDQDDGLVGAKAKGGVCIMKRGKGGKKYKQCYCYRFVKAAVAGRISLSGGEARNAYGQLAGRKGWSKVGFAATRIGDICVWGGKGAGHVAVKKACGWYWGFCTKAGSKRPLMGCFHQH